MEGQADSRMAPAGLDPFTEYGFKVRATNAAGHSDWSSMSCLRTASGPPTAPSNLHADGAPAQYHTLSIFLTMMHTPHGILHACDLPLLLA